MSRFAFIYNPEARGGKSESKIKELIKRIKGVPKAQFFRSETKGDISTFIEQNFDNFDVFVACGGDGTIQEVASKLIHTDKKMGIIPLGTGNDLCKTLKIPTNIDQSLEIVLHGKTTKIDVGRCNNFIFLNVLGFGFDGLTNSYALQMKGIHPLIQYSLSALRATINHQAFNVSLTTNEKSYQKQAIMVTLANGRVEGGAFWVAPDALVTDGKLNLVMISPIMKWLIPFLLPLFLFKKAHWIRHVQSVKTEKVTLEFEHDLDIHADGEIIKSNSNKFSIDLLPKALSVMTGLK